jgi:hypothetical protein
VGNGINAPLGPNKRGSFYERLCTGYRGYTLYAPPNHRDGVIHHTRVNAEADNEHFDGKTTE